MNTKVTQFATFKEFEKALQDDLSYSKDGCIYKREGWADIEFRDDVVEIGAGDITILLHECDMDRIEKIQTPLFTSYYIHLKGLETYITI